MGYKIHEIENIFNLNIEFNGQKTEQIDIYDHKYFTINF
jgi:hypothetical protein